MIDRNQFVEELKLREHIRKAIKIIREKKADKAKALLEEENRLRSVIRKLINEKEGEGDESTGIAFLRQDLKKILPELEDSYTSLRTSVDQRNSYRAHILNAIQNLITVSDTNFNATPDKDPGEEAVGIEEQIDVNIGDDAPDTRKRIDVGREKPEEESEVDAEKAKEESELEDFAIAGEDRTGAVRALRSMKQIENVIKKTYNGLFDQNDRDIYADYLITNLQLYFDEFEEELQAVVPEPNNPDYDQRKTADASGGQDSNLNQDTGLALEEEDPL
tara:strand:- start:5113 stop:5940 length:828 start_codon:yes stop_codon:yes gene_type:complete